MDPLSSQTPTQVLNRLVNARDDYDKLIESYAEEFSKDILIPFCKNMILVMWLAMVHVYLFLKKIKLK